MGDSTEALNEQNELITQAEFARRLGVSKEAVRKAVRDGRITLTDGMLEWPAVQDAWQANTDPSKPKGTTDAATASFAGHRATREEWLAKEAELRYRERAGDLVPRSEVEAATFEEHRRVRDRLRMVEARIGPLLSPEAREMLRAEIRDACNELGGQSKKDEQ